MPNFSVIIPTYNRPVMLKRAVESVRAQSYEDFELIIVDDGSEDTVGEFIKGLSNDKTTSVHMENNSGSAAARNAGLDQAQGSYIAFLDDDDEYQNIFLDNAWKALEGSENDSSVYVCSSVQKNYSKDSSYPVGSEQFVFAGAYGDYEEKLMSFLSVGIGCGVAIKHDCLRHHIGYFDENYSCVEDTELFLRIVQNGFNPILSTSTDIILHNHLIQ